MAKNGVGKGEMRSVDRKLASLNGGAAGGMKAPRSGDVAFGVVERDTSAE